MFKHDRGQKREKMLPQEVYFSHAYFDKEQLFAFSEQIHLLHRYSLNSSHILEIGKGNGFVSEYFKRGGYNCTTFDINPSLEPDIIGDILKLSDIIAFAPDVILCCEVLEHLEFGLFEQCIEQLHTVTKHYVIITLPSALKTYGINLEIRLPKKKVFSVPLFFSTHFGKKIAPEHCWELDSSQNTAEKVVREIFLRYFKIVEQGIFPSNPYHHYYVLEKAFR